MLTLTRKTEYALIAMCHLAHDTGGCSSAREMAERYEMPLPLLMNVLKQLAQSGLAQSVRGPRGGYTLALPPNNITLNDIIQAIEGPIHLVQCVSVRKQDGQKQTATKNDSCVCERMSLCPVRSSIHRVHHRLVNFLKTVTLVDIVDKARVGSTTKTPSGAEGPSR
jgi:Rrf2 family protein